MKSKKVIGLLLALPPGWSETFLNLKIKNLRDSGYKVILFVIDKTDSNDIDTIEEWPTRLRKNPLTALSPFLFEFLINFSKVKQYLKVLKKNQIHGVLAWKKVVEHLHILAAKPHFLHAAFATQALGKEYIAESLNAKFSTSFRGFDLVVFPIKNPNCYLKLWPRLNKVHSISNYLVQKAVDLGMPDDLPVSIILPASKSYGFKKRLFRDDKMRLLFVGRLHWIKGLTSLTDALKQVSLNNIPFEMTLVGDGPMLESLTFQVHQLGLSQQVHFVGKKNQEELEQLYHSHDYYIQPSISEGFCNALLEAQQAGLFCLASNAGAIPENVIHNQTGLLFEPYHPQKMAAEIIRAWNMSSEEKLNITAHAAQRAESLFNPEIQKSEFNSFFS